MKMTSKTFLRSAAIFVVILMAFVISRKWVLANPPTEYSDVKQDYERYANMWRYGLTPYREHLYEYPPATIPVVYLPLELDQRGVGKYYPNYRDEIFIIEFCMFVFVVCCLWGYPVSRFSKVASLLFYLIAGMIAKDFWYEGIDLVFFGSITCLLAWVYASDQSIFKNRLLTWILFWFSVAVKLITFPLAVPIFLMSKSKKLSSELMASFLGGLIVWVVPLLAYRSSLSVFLVFHASRPLKFGAFGSYIIELINDFTKTEHRVQIGPDYPMSGPVSDIVTKIDSILFPVAIALFLLWSGKQILQCKSLLQKKMNYLIMHNALVLSYVFMFFLTTKTFSSPFHIWYIPLLAIYPFTTQRSRIAVFLGALLMLGLDTTPYLKAPAGYLFNTIPFYHLRDALRFIPMILMFGYFASRVKIRQKPKKA